MDINQPYQRRQKEATNIEIITNNKQHRMKYPLVIEHSHGKSIINGGL
jgi:hypothetical protein